MYETFYFLKMQFFLKILNIQNLSDLYSLKSLQFTFVVRLIVNDRNKMEYIEATQPESKLCELLKVSKGRHLDLNKLLKEHFSNIDCNSKEDKKTKPSKRK